ncbi:MAG: hypothetical protein PWQ25_1831 [Deferribacteres bacterium]|jgi:hypothetical protein|nr:hypothetical protein [Deferribacteres bacterium]
MIRLKVILKHLKREKGVSIAGLLVLGGTYGVELGQKKLELKWMPLLHLKDRCSGRRNRQ